MLIPGIVSITYRKLEPAALIQLAAKAGLKTIEWGGDIHVPHGDVARATEVGRLTREAGLSVACYGSYYRLGTPEKSPSPEAVLDSAEALGAPLIRVWAGIKGSTEATGDDFNAVVEDALRLADFASGRGLSIAYEFHANTLHDNARAAQRLLKATTHPAISTLWQPINHADTSTNLASLEALAAHLTNLHVFHWTFPEGRLIRNPLENGQADWAQYLTTAARIPGDHACLLEFVVDDDPGRLQADAATLIEWLRKLPQQ
jgi:3-dehydroshikimate dehydratase